MGGYATSLKWSVALLILGPEVQAAAWRTKALLEDCLLAAMAVGLRPRIPPKWPLPLLAMYSCSTPTMP
jgi:hypothetical protein